MLLEKTMLWQNPREGRRRWFFDPYFDLIVWYEPRVDEIVGLQLCYARGRGEHALVWEAGRGFSHYRVDDGETPGRSKMSPVFVAGAALDVAEVSRRFRIASEQVEPAIRNLVLDKLEEYGRRKNAAAAVRRGAVGEDSDEMED